MNYIIFTQDIPGERNWLKKKFAGCEFLESHDSGKWPCEYPITLAQDSVWEVPPDVINDVSHWSGQTFKSLFNLDFDVVTNRWTDSDNLLVAPGQFNRNNLSDKALVLHLPRSGTVFLQTILSNFCGYERIVDWVPGGSGPRTNHEVPHLPTTSELGVVECDLITQYRPDIFFVYRKDWWEWVVSNLVGIKIGYFHYDTVPDLSNIPLLHITKNDIERLVRTVAYAFNNLCYLASRFRDLNFYVFEYSELITHQPLTDHKKINYNKKNLFENYNEMKEMFDQEYKDVLCTWSTRCLNHLAKMECKFPTTFNPIQKVKAHV
jgi:hypothetical protein